MRFLTELSELSKLSELSELGACEENCSASRRKPGIQADHHDELPPEPFGPQVWTRCPAHCLDPPREFRLFSGSFSTKHFWAAAG